MLDWQPMVAFLGGIYIYRVLFLLGGWLFMSKEVVLRGLLQLPGRGALQERASGHSVCRFLGSALDRNQRNGFSTVMVPAKKGVTHPWLRLSTVRVSAKKRATHPTSAKAETLYLLKAD